MAPTRKRRSSPPRRWDCDRWISPGSGSSFLQEIVTTSFASAPQTRASSRSKFAEPVMRGPVNAALLCLASCSLLAAQDPARFEVVSIKRHVALDTSGGTQNLPDGTYIMINQPISTIIGLATPTVVREVIGAPDWVDTERYDVTTKPPAGSTPAQRREMTRQMFIERMKFVGHV